MIITIDARMINMSGIGRYLQSLIPILLNQKNNQHFLLGKIDELQEYSECENVSLIQVKSKLYSPLEQFELMRKVPLCDLYFSPHFITPFFPIKAKKRITTIHDLFHLSSEADFSFLKNIYLKVLYSTAAKRSDRIITVSQFSRKELIRHFPVSKKKIVVINSCLERSLFSPSQIKAKIANKYILYVGNIKPHKNIVRLIEAFIKMANKKLSLVIVGDKDGFINGIKGFDEIIGDNKNIIFTGRVDDSQLKSLYTDAEFFVFPTLYEGFGLPPLEAMSCGTAVAASSIEVVREVCKDSALYFDPLSIEDMSLKMSRLLDDNILRNELILKGEKLCSHYSKNIFIDKHLEVFTDV